MPNMLVRSRSSRIHSVPMPSLPRIRRTRARDTVVAVRRRRRRLLSSAPPASPGSTSTRPTLDAAQACSPSASAGIRSTSRTCCPSASGRRSTTTPTRATSSASSTSRSTTASIQRLNAAELDFFVGPDYLVTLPTVELLPGDAPLPPLRGGRGVPRAALLEGLGPAALRGARRPVRLLLPDPRQDRAQARLARGRRVRGPLGGGRPRHLERQAGDHQLPEDHQAGALDAARCSSGTSSGSCPRSSSSTSTTSSTPPSASGTSSTTTRRSSRRSRTRTSR